jgi:uncharacterized membrane protein YdjX (TVP38/TMEM64 family)
LIKVAEAQYMQIKTPKTGTIVWALIVVLVLGLYLLNADRLKPQDIANLILKNRDFAVWIYFLISIVRAFFLIPSTPFVLAGLFIFPDSPFLVLAISMASIFLASSLIYYFSGWMGFSQEALDKYPKSSAKLRRVLSSQYGFFYLVAWAFFPFAPTDLACYVAGIVKMRYINYITAVMIGEFGLCSIYLFVGENLLSLF